MISYLVYIFSLFALLYRCESACHTAKTAPTDGRSGVCVYKDLEISSGSTITFNKDCERCSCSDNGYLLCCDTGFHIVQVPNDCKVVKNGCQEKAVSIHDENLPCAGEVAAIGR